MDAFVWDERFVTGLKTVDAQHMHLVGLVNKVGDFLLENRGDETALQAVFGELASYANEHFCEEEGLMGEFAVDSRHSKAHTMHHRDFVIRQRLRGRFFQPIEHLATDQTPFELPYKLFQMVFDDPI